MKFNQKEIDSRKLKLNNLIEAKTYLMVERGYVKLDNKYNMNLRLAFNEAINLLDKEIETQRDILLTMIENERGY